MTPDPNSVNIRFEISIPVGVNVRLERAGDPPQPPLIPTPPLKLFFDTAGNPASGVAYGPFPDICVRPIANSVLGAISIFFTFSSAPVAVKAVNYPLALDHFDATPPGSAVLGTPNANNTIWTWNNLCNADHSQTLKTTQNVVRLWTQATPSSAFLADTTTFKFYGYSGSGSPCGGGSGSPASVATGAQQPDLQLQVPDGPKAGQYPAKSVGSLRWEVAIAGTVYSIRMPADESAAFFSCSAATVMSKSAGKRPFYAIFPGEPVGAANDLVVFQQ